MTIVINFFAGPGSGKSTMAAGLYHHLKMDGCNCELVREYAKDLTWGKSWKTLTNQFYVSAKQWNRESILFGEVDVIITDSPTILGLFYYKEENQKISSAFTQLLLSMFESKTNLNFFINRKKEYNSSGRNQTEEEAKAIDSGILQLLNKYNITFDCVDGTIEGQEKLYQTVHSYLNDIKK
jgi:tRNA uridine 5-carbamoylmethylation protein Kti12